MYLVWFCTWETRDVHTWLINAIEARKFNVSPARRSKRRGEAPVSLREVHQAASVKGLGKKCRCWSGIGAVLSRQYSKPISQSCGQLGYPGVIFWGSNCAGRSRIRSVGIPKFYQRVSRRSSTIASRMGRASEATWTYVDRE